MPRGGKGMEKMEMRNEKGERKSISVYFILFFSRVSLPLSFLVLFFFFLSLSSHLFLMPSTCMNGYGETPGCKGATTKQSRRLFVVIHDTGEGERRDPSLWLYGP